MGSLIGLGTVSTGCFRQDKNWVRTERSLEAAKPRSPPPVGEGTCRRRPCCCRRRPAKWHIFTRRGFTQQIKYVDLGLGSIGKKWRQDERNVDSGKRAKSVWWSPLSRAKPIFTGFRRILRRIFGRKSPSIYWHPGSSLSEQRWAYPSLNYKCK